MKNWKKCKVCGCDYHLGSLPECPRCKINKLETNARITSEQSEIYNNITGLMLCADRLGREIRYDVPIAIVKNELELIKKRSNNIIELNGAYALAVIVNNEPPDKSTPT